MLNVQIRSLDSNGVYTPPLLDSNYDGLDSNDFLMTF